MALATSLYEVWTPGSSFIVLTYVLDEALPWFPAFCLYHQNFFRSSGPRVYFSRYVLTTDNFVQIILWFCIRPRIRAPPESYCYQQYVSNLVTAVGAALFMDVTSS